MNSLLIHVFGLFGHIALALEWQEDCNTGGNTWCKEKRVLRGKG